MFLDVVIAKIGKKLIRNSRKMEDLIKSIKTRLANIKNCKRSTTTLLKKAIARLIEANQKALAAIRDTNRRLNAEEGKLNYSFNWPEEGRIGPEILYTGFFTEIDLITKRCKVVLEHDLERRINGFIKDPLLKIPNNPYVKAFSERRMVKFKAKAIHQEDGRICTLYINDVEAQLK